MKTTPMLLSLALTAWFSTAPSFAQPESAKSSEETLEALLIVSLKRDMNLDTAEAVDLASKARPMLEARREFARQQARERRELTQLLKSAKPDPAAIDSHIQKIFQLRAAFAEAQQQAFAQLSAGLDPTQRGQLFLSLEQFEERVRKQLNRFQERRQGRRSGADRADGKASEDDL